ncbi:hypothetical protein GCM10022278_10180 [Allohahella marinimesophila]|uniref:TNase-like domain-containing protein n=1 Tax=Allohahella marinimesophila TaxID=1054972 RepID=A0ABP7NSF5_9GAMM
MWLALVFSQHLAAEVLKGIVVSVADGDTITLLDDQRRQHKIRLGGIDAPERRQAFGQVSRSNMADLVFNKAVEVEWHKRDRYDRIIGKVVVAGEDAGLTQIRMGLAWHYKHYLKDQSPEDQRAYAIAELAARTAGSGLWQHSDPQPPWDFRRKR